MFGNADETEQTFIETITLRDAIPAAKLDFSTLGMIMQSIGIFYDNQQAKEDQEMVERLMRIGLAAGPSSTFCSMPQTSSLPCIVVTLALCATQPRTCRSRCKQGRLASRG